MRYFFDVRDGDQFTPDLDGLEYATIEEARDAATAALADAAKDAIPGKIRREIAVEVRDVDILPILRASLWFEVQVLRP